MLLKSIGKIKCVIQFKSLKYIQPSAQNNLPAMIRRNVAIVLCSGGVIRPGELDSYALTSVGDLLQVLSLALTIELIFNRNHMYGYLFIGAFKFTDRLHQIH